ncbi:MAG: hypothetical protein ACLPWF_05580 [Bryobacteraceae bacterium]|jgi:hypothetical protein
MKQDQWRLVTLFDKVREQAGDDELPELNDLEADLRVYIQLENTILFERVLQLVSQGALGQAERR